MRAPLGPSPLISRPRKSRLFNPIRSFEAQTVIEANSTYFGTLRAKGLMFHPCSVLGTKQPSGRGSNPFATWRREIVSMRKRLGPSFADQKTPHLPSTFAWQSQENGFYRVQTLPADEIQRRSARLLLAQNPNKLRSGKS